MTDLERVELLPCPFCGGEAKRFTIDDADEPANAGGDVITCTRCGASSHVEFGHKENLVDRWNTRPLAMRSASPVDTGDAIKTLSRENRELREALERIKAFDDGERMADECWDEIMEIARTTLGKESAAIAHPGKER